MALARGVVPVPGPCLPFALDPESPVRQTHGDRSVEIRPENSGSRKARKNVRLRMPEAVAVSNRDDRGAGADRGQEVGARGGTAAVVGNEQHVGAQRGTIAADERRLGRTLD